MEDLATIGQIQYIEKLCYSLGYDTDAYVTNNLTKRQASVIIDELKEEAGY